MVGIKLKEFQEKCVEELLEQTVFGEKKEILLQAPTGSGKTIMLLEYIDRFLLENKDYVFVWLTPGSGELEEQSKNKMNQLLKNRTTKTLNEVLTTGFEEQDTAFINWENVTKKGNTALRELEKSNLYDRIEQAQNNGIKFIVIIDEEHRNKTEKAESITNLFNAKHTVRVSATTKRNDEAYNIKISEMEVINSGLITKSLYINQGIENNILLDDEIEYLFTVPEHVFNPPPKVKSAVIKMTRNQVRQLGCNEPLFKRIVKTAFNQRRKTMRNSLKSMVGQDCKILAEPIFNERPERLSVKQFIDLTNLLESYIIK
jgi:type III restriction enzyme